MRFKNLSRLKRPGAASDNTGKHAPKHIHGRPMQKIKAFQISEAGSDMTFRRRVLNGTDSRWRTPKTTLNSSLTSGCPKMI